MVQKATTTPTVEVENPQQCRHHWVIQPAMGPVSQGVCQLCGEDREFQNYVEAASWGNSKHADRANEAGKGVMPLTNSADPDDEEE